ncbi:MAG: tetratricopeptide repeat protein [bacterium]
MYQANNPQEYEDLGYQFWRKGNMEEALKIFREAVNRFPDNLNLNLCLGFCYIDMDEYVDARRIFESILNHYRGNADALMGMGKIFLTMSKFEEAEMYFRQILEANPENEMLYLEIARGYYEVNCPEDALGYYKGALSINPESEEGLFGLGVCYHILARIDSAKFYINKALEIENGSFRDEALCYYGHLMYDEERFDEALKCFEQVPLERLNDITSLNRMLEIYKEDKGESDDRLTLIHAKIASLERINKRRNPLYNIKVKAQTHKSPEVFFRCRQKELNDSDSFTCGECPHKYKRTQQRRIVIQNKLVGFWMSCDLTSDELQKMEFGDDPGKGRYIKKVKF